MGELPILGQELSKHIVDLSLAPLDTMQQAKEAEELVERMCIMIEDELRAQGLSDSEDAFIQRHGESVFTRVQDPWLRGIPITFEM